MGQTLAAVPQKTPVKPPAGKRRVNLRSASLALLSLLLLAGAYEAFRWFRAHRVTASAVPTARVERGDLNLAITAKGDLRGQNPEVLTAPMTGGNELHLTYLLTSGTPVKEGDVVVKFDTAEQEYKLKEAEADLAEAQQHVLQAKATEQAQEEEDRYALLKAAHDVTLAELDVRKDPLLAAITAKQNDLALAGARDHQEQLTKNLANRKATNDAAAKIQEAGSAKAEAQAAAARDNIEAMTLRANRAGYVSVDRNANVDFFFSGMTLPFFQVGDPVRPGMAVAEIPDLKNWEVEANIGELDRGHIAVNDPVEITVIAVPGHLLHGHVKDVGGVSGPPWNRHFTCKLALDQTLPELRPGMSALLSITTDRLRNVLWLPAQALFQNEQRTFVYTLTGGAFAPHDVKLVRRNETRVVIEGLKEGQVVALADPLEIGKKQPARGGALPALTR